MKVRATADGTYGGYYRHGPVIGADGTIPGEVFEISDEVIALKDPESGKPAMEQALDKDGNGIMERVQRQAVDNHGNIVVDEKHRPVMVWTEKPKMQARTTSHFSPAWMERVHEDTPVTYDYAPFEIPVQYREMKKRPPVPVLAPAGQNLLPVI